MFIHLHLCGFYLMLCQSLRITPGSCSHPTWPCACGPCAPSRPPRSRTRCGSCPSCVQRLLSWLWTGLWSCWPGFLHSKTSSRVQMSSFHWSYYVVLANKNQGGRQDEENDTTRDKAWSEVSWLAIKKTLLWMSKRSKKTGRIYHPVSKPWSPSSSWTGWTWAGCAEPGCRRESRCNSGPTARPLPAGCWNAAGGQTSATWLSQSRRKSLSGLNLNWVCSGH